MRNSRGTIVAAALLGLALSGCGGSVTSEQPGTPAAAADPQAVLTAATLAMAKGNYAYTATMPHGTATASVDLPSGSAAITLETASWGGDVKFEMVFAEPDRWVRTTMDTAKVEAMLTRSGDPATVEQARQVLRLFGGGTWLHYDASTIAVDTGLDPGDGSDPLGVATAARVDARTITGTLDLSAKTMFFGVLNKERIAGMGAAAKALLFTANLDDRGRLAKLAIEAPATGDIPAGTWTFTIFGYGEQKAQVKPDGPVTEATEEWAAGLTGP